MDFSGYRCSIGGWVAEWLVVSQKRPPFIFWITLSKINRFLAIFGVINPEKMRHENLTDLSTSPVKCSHFTLGNPEKSFSTVLFIHTSDYLCYLRRKQTVIHLPTPHEIVTTLARESQNFFIWLKVCCVLSNVGGSEKSQLWVVVGSGVVSGTTVRALVLGRFSQKKLKIELKDNAKNE